MTAVASTRHPGVRRRTSDPVLLWHQTRHELVALRRTPITLILSIGLPLLFFVLLSALIGNEVVDERGGVRVVQFLAPGMAAFGVVMATFSFLSIGLAEARSTGVVKRQSGAPVPRWVLIGGRMGAALLLGLTSTALVLAAGVAFYDLQVPSRSALAVLATLVLASACFSALGLALAMALPTMQLTIAVSNGIVIPLAFISDMFMMTGQMPDWLATIGWLFPLKHLTAVFADALNPYLSGSGFELDHLAVIALWGLAGAVVATVQLRRDRDRDAARRSDARPRARARRRVTDSAPRRTSAPPWAALLTEQVRHAQSVLWRNPSAVFFAVAFPVLLVAIIPAVNGGGEQVMDSGQTLGVFYAGTMAIYGAAVTAYVNMPQGVAEARDRGVLKRTGGTPLPAAALVVGRVVGALAVALLTGLAIIVLAALVFRPPVPPGLGAAVVVLALSAVCFAVVGLAVMTFVHSAQALTGVTLGTLLP
ncbi:MAG TPA: ABC transporter permease, partial [Ornithinibacter sp.]|nr:ABC transporter permease [Ornithinibacter sp.]